MGNCVSKTGSKHIRVFLKGTPLWDFAALPFELKDIQTRTKLQAQGTQASNKEKFKTRKG